LKSAQRLLSASLLALALAGCGEPNTPTTDAAPTGLAEARTQLQDAGCSFVVGEQPGEKVLDCAFVKAGTAPLSKDMTLPQVGKFLKEARLLAARQEAALKAFLEASKRSEDSQASSPTQVKEAAMARKAAQEFSTRRANIEESWGEWESKARQTLDLLRTGREKVFPLLATLEQIEKAMGDRGATFGKTSDGMARVVFSDDIKDEAELVDLIQKYQEVGKAYMAALKQSPQGAYAARFYKAEQLTPADDSAETLLETLDKLDFTPATVNARSGALTKYIYFAMAADAFVFLAKVDLETNLDMLASLDALSDLGALPRAFNQSNGKPYLIADPKTLSNLEAKDIPVVREAGRKLAKAMRAIMASSKPMNEDMALFILGISYKTLGSMAEFYETVDKQLTNAKTPEDLLRAFAVASQAKGLPAYLTELVKGMSNPDPSEAVSQDELDAVLTLTLRWIDSETETMGLTVDQLQKGFSKSSSRENLRGLESDAGRLSPRTPKGLKEQIQQMKVLLEEAGEEEKPKQQGKPDPEVRATGRVETV